MCSTVDNRLPPTRACKLAVPINKIPWEVLVSPDTRLTADKTVSKKTPLISRQKARLKN